MRNKLKVIAIFFSIVLAGIGCQKFLPQLPADDAVLDGPVEGLNHEQSAAFLRGDIAFNDEVFTTQNGLGPLFVATSCGSCHAVDGKGHPFTTLTRFGQSDTINGNLFLNSGGPQLQDRAIPGHMPEQIPDILSPFASFGSANARIAASGTASINPSPVFAGGANFENVAPAGICSGI